MRPEPKPPSNLQHLQEGFGRSIRTPLIIEDDGYTYNTARYDQDVASRCLPNHLFTGTERLSIYNHNTGSDCSRYARVNYPRASPLRYCSF